MSQAESQGPRPFRLPGAVPAVASWLPQYPHSVALALALNLVLKPLLSADAMTMLRGRVVGIRVDDAAIDFRLRLGAHGFAPASPGTRPEVVFSASAFDFYLMARRLEDPDALFFTRRLRIEGDTELGLVVKNALDAVEWQGLPAPLRAVLERAGGLVQRFGDRR